MRPHRPSKGFVGLWAGAAVLAGISSAAAQDDDYEFEIQAEPDPAVDPHSGASSSETTTADEGSGATTVESATNASDDRFAAPPEDSETSETAVAEPAVEPQTTGDDAAALVLQTETVAFAIDGYVQAQYVHSQLSEDQLQQGGAPLNQDRFVLRRARLNVQAAGPWYGARIELDANTSQGANVSVRRGEAELRYLGGHENPLVALTAGLTTIPFGHELRYGHERRIFLERSLASTALFPGEPDVGARIWGVVGPFVYDVAALNGSPVTDRPGTSGIDPIGAPDYVGRLGVDTSAGPLTVQAGASFLIGEGFAPGTDATRDDVQWRDLDQDSVIDAGELTSVPGRAATPSETFERWGIGLDARLVLETPMGDTELYGEVVLASNLDRALLVANPVATGIDFREFGAYVAVVQDVLDYGLLGFRFDTYDPNSDALDSRRGAQIPVNSAIRTFSPLLGVRLSDHGRLVFQYDIVRDRLARDVQGVPTDLDNDRWTVRLQVSP